MGADSHFASVTGSKLNLTSTEINKLANLCGLNHYGDRNYSYSWRSHDT